MLFSYFEEKSASKVLKTGYFAYSLGQWGELLPLQPPTPSYATGHKAEVQKNQFKNVRLSEVESRTQGSRPRPRPRTQKNSEAKAKDSPSEDRTSRGQGQECSRPRPRTKDTGASVLQKKSLQNFFSGDHQFVGVPRIYWDKPKPQIT